MSKLQIGDRVMQDMYGKGTIVAVNDTSGVCQVKFDKDSGYLAKKGDRQNIGWFFKNNLKPINEKPPICNAFRLGEIIYVIMGTIMKKARIINLHLETCDVKFDNDSMTHNISYDNVLKREVIEGRATEFKPLTPPAEKPCPPDVLNLDGLIMVFTNGRYYLFNKEGHCLKEFIEVQDGDRSIKETV